MIEGGSGRFASIFMAAMLFAAPALADGSTFSDEIRSLAVPVSGDHLSRVRGETYAGVLAAAPSVDRGGVSDRTPGGLIAPVSRNTSAVAHAHLIQIQTDVSMTAQ